MIEQRSEATQKKVGNHEGPVCREACSMCKRPVVEKSIAYEKISESPRASTISLRASYLKSPEHLAPCSAHSWHGVKFHVWICEAKISLTAASPISSSEMPWLESQEAGAPTPSRLQRLQSIRNLVLHLREASLSCIWLAASHLSGL